MNRKTGSQLEYKDPSIGAIPEVEVAGVMIIGCMLLIAACFAAPLLLKVPQTMDGAVSSRPTIREVSAGVALRSPAVDGAASVAAHKAIRRSDGSD